MTEPVRLIHWLGLDIYPYGLCVAAAMLLGCVLLCALAGGRFGKPAVGLSLALWLLPAGLVCARLMYLLVRWHFIGVDYVPGFWFRLWLGGFSLAGGGTGVDSFNVSVATGIILYEIMRQRGTEGSI